MANPNVPDKFALTLESDGWSGLQKEHVLNIMIAAPRPFFLAKSGNSKYIDKYPIKTLVTDNASVMQKTCRGSGTHWTLGCAWRPSPDARPKELRIKTSVF